MQWSHKTLHVWSYPCIKNIYFLGSVRAIVILILIIGDFRQLRAIHHGLHPLAKAVWQIYQCTILPSHLLDARWSSWRVLPPHSRKKSSKHMHGFDHFNLHWFNALIDTWSKNLNSLPDCCMCRRIALVWFSLALLMANRHWSKHQSINWTNIDYVLWLHMALLGNNKIICSEYQKFWRNIYNNIKN